MQSILVIGAGGFIGRLVCAELSRRGVAVHATTRSRVDIPGAATVEDLDINDAAATQRVVNSRPYDTIYFLAAVTEHHKLVGDPLGTLDAYVGAAINIARAAIQSSASRLVFSSTGKVYGDTGGRPITETDPIVPSNVLGRIKVITENILKFSFATAPDKSLILARIFNIYGPGQKPSFVIPTILDQLRNGPEVKLGNLDDGRDYLYISDLIDALVRLHAVPLSSPIEVFNIGSGTSRTVRDILTAIEATTGRAIQVSQRADKLRHDEHSSERADIGKLTSLGWQPATSFTDGMRATISAYAPELLP